MKRFSKYIFIIFIFQLIFYFNCLSQPHIKYKAGFGYQEHFSLGVGLQFKNKNQLSVLVGSDAFINMNYFSTYLIEYQISFSKLLHKDKISPIAGLRAGYIIYSDYYYRWEALTGIPYAGISYQLNSNIQLQITGGAAINRELAVNRRNSGEIGWYKRVLPEVKVALVFNLKTNNND